MFPLNKIEAESTSEVWIIVQKVSKSSMELVEGYGWGSGGVGRRLGFVYEYYGHWDEVEC